MTDTKAPQPDEYEDEDEDIETSIFVEKETSLLYEVRFFQDHCFVRPCSPVLFYSIRRMSHDEFFHEFDEYFGDHRLVRDLLRNMAEAIVVDDGTQ